MMISKGYESVWDALEDDLAVRENLKIRAALMMEIERYVKESGFTQTQAAERLGTQQSRLNDVLRGRIDKCTIDRLINMLAAVGRKVEFTVKDAA